MAKIKKHLKSHINKSHWRSFLLDYEDKLLLQDCRHDIINKNALTGDNWCDECGITMKQ